MRPFLTVDSDNEPPWLRLYMQPYANEWAARLVGDDLLPPAPGTVTRLTFFGAMPEEAQQEAKAYLGLSEPVN